METLEGASTMEKMMMERASRMGAPINGSLELLPLCNMNCNMCYVRLSKPEMEARGRLRTGEEWLALGKELAEAGNLFLLLTGGEPLLHPDFKEIYLGLKKMGLILTINTNGTLINEEWAAFFGQHKPRRINITLYGADDEAYKNLCHYPGGFSKVVEGVKLLRQQNVDVKLACTLTPDNQKELRQMYRIAEELDVPMFTDTYIMSAERERERDFDCSSRVSPEEAAAARLLTLRLTWGEADYRVLRRRLLEEVDAFAPGEENPSISGCMAGRCSFTVNWQGQLRPCVIQTEPAADVFEVGFVEAWKKVQREYLQIRYCASCSNCRLRSLCNPCPAASLVETGDYMGRPEYLCRYAAETERLLRLEEEAEADA